MNVFSTEHFSKIKKKLFNLKPIQKDGLILQIHHTTQVKSKLQQIRFLYSAFDASGLVLASADLNGSVFIVDFSCNKFWSLPKFNSCSVLSFSNLSELIIGTNGGELYICDIHSAVVSVCLVGHKYPVKSVSYNGNQCLTASHCEAIIFDLSTNTKIHELSLDVQTGLKHVSFMPVTSDVLVCFADDFIHVWKNTTFESYKQILPTDWKKINVRCIAFTRNGTTMVLAGYSSKLIIFSLDSWTLTHILTLPSGINSMKSLEFISQKHDGGANKFLIILTNDGVLYFLNMETSIVIGQIKSDSEIISFACSTNGTYLACVLHSGEVNVFKLDKYIEPQVDYYYCDKFNHCSRKKKLKYFVPQQKQIADDYLDIKKLQGILKEYGEYPETYRSLIWTKILELPINAESYASIVQNTSSKKCFRHIDKKYPLINKSALKNLKKLLSNLGNWCPIFCYIDFMPLFVFPFLKVFENDPIISFEAMITIILNWCQYWFEYIPCAPINILAMIENVFVLHDAELLLHLSQFNITSHQYAWSLLEVAFSETLKIKDWLILWDHIFTNEPSFLLMIPIAYNILHRSLLLSFTSPEHFESFYHTQNPLSIKKLVKKSYYLLENTCEASHPRQYLEYFTKLPTGNYPIFDSYPKLALDAEMHQLKAVEETEDELKRLEKEITVRKVTECEEKRMFQVKVEENKRMQKLEDIYHEKMQKENERITQQRLQLSRLRTKLSDQQAEALETSCKKLEEINLNSRKKELNKLISNIDQNSVHTDFEIQKTEEEISKHYVELLKQKSMLESHLSTSKVNNKCYGICNENQRKLTDELKKIQELVNIERIATKLTVPIHISVINDKLADLNMTYAKEMAIKNERLQQSHKNNKLIKIKNDTKCLEKNVHKLLEDFKVAKQNEAKSVLLQLAKSLEEKRQQLRKEKDNLDSRSCACDA